MLPPHVQTSAGVLGVIESSTTSAAQVRLLHLTQPSTISVPLGQINLVVPHLEDSVTVVKGPLAGSKGVLKTSQGHFVLACGNNEFVLCDSGSLGKNHLGQLGYSACLPVSNHELRISNDDVTEVLSNEGSPSVQQAMSVCGSPSPAPSPFIPGLSPLQLGSNVAAKEDDSPGDSVSSTPTMSIAGDPASTNDTALVNGGNWDFSHPSGNHMTPSPCHMTSSNTDLLAPSDMPSADCHLTPSSHMMLRNPVAVDDNCQLSSTGSHMTYMNGSHVTSDYNDLGSLGLDSCGSYFDTGCMPPTSSYPVSVCNASEFTSVPSSYHPSISYPQQYVDTHHMLLSHQDPHHVLLARSIPHTSVYDPSSVAIMHQSNPNFALPGAEHNFGSTLSPLSSPHAYMSQGYHARMRDFQSMARMRMMMHARRGMQAGLDPRMYMHPRLAGIRPPMYQAHRQAYSQGPCPQVDPIFRSQQLSPQLQQTHSQVQRVHSHPQLNPQTQTAPTQLAPNVRIHSQEHPQILLGSAGITSNGPASFSESKCGSFKSLPTKEQVQCMIVCVRMMMDNGRNCR